MASLKDQIDLNKLPEHIAIIMDGNGRWAKKHNKPRIFGHRNGVLTVRKVTEAAAELGVSVVTVYAFSTENWSRPPLEVSALMGLLVETLRKEINALNKNDIRLTAIGDLNQLPSKTRRALEEGIEKTKGNTRMTLNLALNYSGRWDILSACKKVISKVHSGEMNVEDLNEKVFDKQLSTAEFKDPDLMIRTSGENRISNYLLWQMAYTELYFTDVYWPDFTDEELYKAIIDYQLRERRFGKTSEQIV